MGTGDVHAYECIVASQWRGPGDKQYIVTVAEDRETSAGQTRVYTHRHCHPTTTLPIEVGPTNWPHYFDLANIDRYDAILGTPFLYQTGTVLDFERSMIVTKGVNIQSHTKARPPKDGPDGRAD